MSSRYPQRWHDQGLQVTRAGVVTVDDDGVPALPKVVGTIVSHRVTGAESPGGMTTNVLYEAVPEGHAQGLCYRSKQLAIAALLGEETEEEGRPLNAVERAFRSLDQAIEPLRRQQGGGAHAAGR